MRIVFQFAVSVAAVLGSNVALAQEPLPESAGSIEYRSVSEALEALKAKPDVSITVTKPDGWIIANEGQAVIWSFTPQGNAAYPAVVRREVLVHDGKVLVEMRVLCQAEKAPCDKLVRDFQDLNERMRLSIQQRLRGAR